MKGDFDFNVHSFQNGAVLNLNFSYILDGMMLHGVFIPSTLSNARIQSCSL